MPFLEDKVAVILLREREHRPDDGQEHDERGALADLARSCSGKGHACSEVPEPAQERPLGLTASSWQWQAESVPDGQRDAREEDGRLSEVEDSHDRAIVELVPRVRLRLAVRVVSVRRGQVRLEFGSVGWSTGERYGR